MSSVLVDSNVLIHAAKAAQETMRVWLETGQVQRVNLCIAL